MIVVEAVLRACWLDGRVDRVRVLLGLQFEDRQTNHVVNEFLLSRLHVTRAVTEIAR